MIVLLIYLVAITITSCIAYTVGRVNTLSKFKDKLLMARASNSKLTFTVDNTEFDIVCEDVRYE